MIPHKKRAGRRVVAEGKIRVLIVGAGTTGTNLFTTIIDEPGVVVTGIVDRRNEFSHLDLACTRGIPVISDISEAMRAAPDIVFHLSESDVPSSEITMHKPAKTEIIGDGGIHFFLTMIHQVRRRIIRGVHLSGETIGESTGLQAEETDMPGKRSEYHAAACEGGKIRNILCIGGGGDVPEWLRETLEPAGYRVTAVKTGREDMGKAAHTRPDLIILDLTFPGTDGFELSRSLEENAATADIPIIVLAAKDVNMETRLKLIGRTEGILQKSCFAEEDLLAHIRDLEMTRPFRSGLLDTVSGLFGRPYFQIRLAQEICRADRYKTIFSILMADLDDFDPYIQANGMDCGHICIRKIADFLRKTTRGSDTIVRYGGDQFALLLASATEEASRIVAQRLLSFMESYRFPGREKLAQGILTASIAVVHYNRVSPCSPEEMISRTQQLLREAKRYGGGNIRIYGQPAHAAEMMNSRG